MAEGDPGISERAAVADGFRATTDDWDQKRTKEVLESFVAGGKSLTLCSESAILVRDGSGRLPFPSPSNPALGGKVTEGVGKPISGQSTGGTPMRMICAAGLFGLILCQGAGLRCGAQDASTSTVVVAERSQPRHGEFGAQRIEIGDETRVYRLVVPKSVDLLRPAPLVVAFHGMLIDSKDLMPKYTRLNQTAGKNGFSSPTPEAVGNSWGISAEKVKGDLAFFDALLAQVASQYRIDPDRVFILGMSNGGYFAHLVARERSQAVAAVASHSVLSACKRFSESGPTGSFPC